MQLDRSADTSHSGTKQIPDRDGTACCLRCYLRPPALRKFSQKDLLLVLAISSSDVGMSFELNTLYREKKEEIRCQSHQFTLKMR